MRGVGRSNTVGRAGRAGTVGLALLVLAFGLGACGSGSALGYDQAPASLDPNSPRLEAMDIAFTTSDLDVPAGVPFILVFENLEGADHNVSIYTDVAASNRLFEGKVFAGPATRWYPVPALAAGVYVFKCDIHATMNGRLHAV